MKKLITILATLATTATLSAKVTLPEIIGDNMVLQQQTQARLWGKAAPKSTVTITPSWNNETIKTKADKDGNQNRDCRRKLHRLRRRAIPSTA